VQRDLFVPRDQFQPMPTSMKIELPMEIFEGGPPAIELSDVGVTIGRISIRR
jgi:hypothetical protein